MRSLFSLQARSAVFAFGFAVAALAGCSASADSADDSATEELSSNPNRVQMNDVSVLYPLAKSASEFNGYLSASTAGLGGPLLPQTLYTKATGAPVDPPTGPLPVGADAGLPYTQLRMVAFRVDPCFANIGPITDPSSCKNQLRIIFQAMAFQNGSTSAVDGAVHAFYSLTREELTELVSALVKLRIANGGTKDLGAVAVHPILAKQGLEGNEAKALSELVLRYAGTTSLTRFTTFHSQNLQTAWTFEGFDVASGKTTAMVIPTLPAKATSVEFFVGFSADFAGGFTPATTAADDMQLLGNLANAQKADKAQQQAAFDAALRIENPDFHSPNTIDCASCHLAGPGSVITGAKLGLSATGNPNAFVADPKHVTKTDMLQTTPVTMTNGLNVHAFSYRNTQPMVAMRVINETAAIVTYINETVLPQK